jgi:hypothetical protein
MSHYAIAISPDEVSREFKAVLRGPGIGSDGRRYVFASPHRCATFIEAVNFAYEQGLCDGARRRKYEEGCLFLVTGATPESLSLRPEGWWDRCKRHLRF